MISRLLLNLLMLLVAHSICFHNTEASTHWLLNNDGQIIPQLTSPFYLRRSYDLIAFLNQNVYKQKIDLIINELLTIKSNLTAKMNNLDAYTNDLTNKIGCIPNFYLDESDILSTIINMNYINRITIPDRGSAAAGAAISSRAVAVKGKSPSPKCGDYMKLDFSLGSFDHLDGVFNRTQLKMAPEDMFKSLEYYIPSVKSPQVLADDLRKNPHSWKYHTIASYYWRKKGNAREAIECARRAIALAPRKYKDIPLLSMGTVLQRSQHVNDSLVVLRAAVDHEPNEPENQMALGNTYMLLSEFNRSFEAYRAAESLDSVYAEHNDYIKKSINCFKDLKINLLTMERLLQDIIPGLERYGSLQKEFDEYHEKLDREQAPLKTRVFDEAYSKQVDFLIQRSQICTTRMTKEKSEPILSCDFISDVQMLMEDFAVEILNNYVDLKKELINTYKINSLGIYKKIFVEHF
ncbi:tetratricopeptide repeat protein 17 [Sabethes cyaneus]|uniref:tetratricopeptide repeat protein 17 n=1 Tax=Sabethes cyaneus TaxID=53552 RepID=UPI00221E2A1C|nr:tetratricopeptide repeat protein 17 [Sabethes cyaneus]XP_053691435.1 tetratricopeptide repeat protein 17 [Sabethes cyaneus]XP_053691441.1 tetratricopeptide repeat protein 17 [Sabethes cyaneus]